MRLKAYITVGVGVGEVWVKVKNAAAPTSRPEREGPGGGDREHVRGIASEGGS